MESGEIKNTFLSASSVIRESHAAAEARPSGMAWGPKVRRFVLSFQILQNLTVLTIFG